MSTGNNTTATTYRMSRDAVTGKQEYGTTPILNGVGVHIGLERLERAQLIDQANALNTYRMTSDEDIDILAGDKVIDSYENEYRVHTVQKERSFNGLLSTIVFITKKV